MADKTKHTDTERIELIQKLLSESPPIKSVARVEKYRQVYFRVPEGKTLRDCLDAQLEGKPIG